MTNMESNMLEALILTRLQNPQGFENIIAALRLEGEKSPIELNIPKIVHLPWKEGPKGRFSLNDITLALDREGLHLI